MRNVILSMMTTLNGRLDDPEAWITGISNELYTDIDREFETFDSILLGSATYEEMAGYWPGAEKAGIDWAESEAGGAEINARMAKKMNAYKKYVFTSRDLKTPLAWNNAEPVRVRTDDDIVRFIDNLKAQPGASIHLAGGAKVAQAAIRLGVIDEYRFNVHPVVSLGQSWFDSVPEKRVLELVSARPYSDGVVALAYRPKQA